jgi:hypothetical protein
MKIFVYQPHFAKTEEELEHEKVLMREKLEQDYPEADITFYSFDNYWMYSGKEALQHYTESLSEMSKADLVCFMPDWENNEQISTARKCVLMFGCELITYEHWPLD